MFVNRVSVRRVTIVAAVLAISGTAVIAPASGATRAAAAQPAAPVMVSTPARTLFDTGSGVRAPHRRLLGGEQVAVYAFGSAGIPPAGVSAVRVRVQTSGASGAGVLSVHHAGTRDSRPLVLSYGKAATRTVTGTVEFDPDGVLQVENVSSARVNVRVWVVGYQPYGTGDQWVTSEADAGHSFANAAAAGVSVTSLAHARARWTLPGGSEPLIADGLSLQVVYDTGPGTTEAVQARDLSTGRLRWSVRGLPGATEPQTAVYAGWLYLVYGAQPLDAVAIDLATHRVVLRTPAAAGLGPAPTAGVADLSLDGGTMHLVIYVPDRSSDTGSSPVLANYDASTGGFLWSRPTTSTQVTAGDGVVLADSGQDNVYDGRTGRLLWSYEGSDGSNAIVAGQVVSWGLGGIYSRPLRGCGKPLCRATWIDTFLSPTSHYSSAVTAASDDGRVIAVSVIITNGLGNPVSTSLHLLSARTGHPFGSVTFANPYARQDSTLIAGSAVLFVYGRDLDSIATTCRGTCAVTRLSHAADNGGDPILGPVAQHTLIFDSDGSGSRAYRID